MQECVRAKSLPILGRAERAANQVWTRCTEVYISSAFLGLGVFFFICSISFGIASYYKEKGIVEPYYVCVKQVTGMLARKMTSRGRSG